MRNILGLIVVLAIGYYIRGVVWNRVTSSITANNSDCLAVLGSTTTDVDGGTYIVGSVQNNCDRSFGNVTVTFKLDRTPGAFESFSGGGAYAYVRDVKAGESKAFKSALPVSKDATFRFDAINAF
jgi:hypothetical protein